ncbi:hypothetical protein QFZ22_003477 [Streptomyces canus]|uniref:Uncharacterized protein n=1 Tax=Streptomyces canus TaxID=58343 RepID=A0AAW8FEQ7_9ACTN|nr:hypothetical protein [Streptomyces canus]MDQ0907492.1 hypothetical protein [Streptomyces canus]
MGRPARAARPGAGPCGGAAVRRGSGAAGQRGVRIYSGGRFGEDGTLDNHIRIPFVADDETLAERFERLAEVCGPGGQVQGRVVTQLRL